MSHRRTSRPGARGTNGFSLIELLIVGTILASLVGGLYGLYDTSVANARLQAMRANRRAIQTSIEHYLAKNDTYPPSLQALTKTFMNEIPDDPTTNYSGTDWLQRGPGGNQSWVSSLLTSPPAGGVAEVRSASGQY